MRPVKVGVDATPLLGRPTGVGRYVAGLLGGLAALHDPPDLVLTAFTARGAGELAERGRQSGATNAEVSARRAPARLLHATWGHTSLPPVELLSGRVDLFHATNFVLPPTRWAAGVVTVHDLAYERWPHLVSSASRRYRTLVPRSLRRAALVFTPSQTVADELADHYRLTADRVVATGLGVDPAWAQARPPNAAWLGARGLPERYLLFVGNIEPRKGLSTLVAAHRALRAQDPTTPPLVLVGPPGWGAMLEPDTDGVVQAGYLCDGDLRQVVAGAACLASPSVYEGFGLPPLEALACGTPVVASDLPAHREALGSSARLVPPGDADALADALAQILRDPPEPSAGRDRAAAWTWNRCAKLTAAGYRTALGI